MPEADTQAPTPPSASSLVANALQTGKPADFTGIPDDRAAEKTVSASFIREAIVRSLVEGPRVRLAMVIKGAIIEGDLSLSGLGTSTDPLPALDLSDCTIKGALDLSDSAWVAVTLDGCALRGLTGQRLRLETSLSARDLSFETVGAVEIDLADLQSGSGLDLTRLGRRMIKPQDAAPDAAKGACFLNLGRSRIGGMLQLGGARLKNPDGDALNLDNADVAGHLHLRSIGHQRFAALGTVWMFSARIGGQVNGVGLCVVNPKGVALAMNGVEVRGHVLLHRSVTYGRSNLTDAKIGGQIDLSAAHIVNPGAVALNLDRADIASHLLMFHAAGRRFASKGAVSMDGAHVGGSVTCYGARIDHSGGYALSMSRMHVVGDVSLCASEDGRFEARGGVQAVGIRVDGLFNGNGGRFVSIHAQRSALTLESATIGGALFIRRGDGFRAEALGEVKAFGATIGGNVECSGAKLVNRRGNALWMEGAEVGGSLLLRQVDRNPFIAIGEVNLRNLKVAGSAAFDGTFSCHGTSDALDLESTHIGTLRVRLSPQSKGVVSLAGAQVDELDDFGGYGWGPEPLPNVRGTGPVGVMLKLDGFNYRRLGPWRPPRAQGL